MSIPRRDMIVNQMLFAVLAYMGVVVSWKVLRMGSVAPLLSQWTFLVGIPVGALFVWFDVIVEAYLHPGGQTTRLLQKTIHGDGGAFDRVRRTIVLVRSLAMREAHLCSQNVLFAGMWIVMALFGLTSTSSGFGKGVVLGIGLQLVVRLFRSLRRFGDERITMNDEPLRWFFWPIRQSFTAVQERLVAGGFLAVFALLTLLV